MLKTLEPRAGLEPATCRLRKVCRRKNYLAEVQRIAAESPRTTEFPLFPRVPARSPEFPREAARLPTKVPTVNLKASNQFEDSLQRGSLLGFRLLDFLQRPVLLDASLSSTKVAFAEVDITFCGRERTVAH